MIKCMVVQGIGFSSWLHLSSNLDPASYQHKIFKVSELCGELELMKVIQHSVLRRCQELNKFILDQKHKENNLVETAT